MAIKTYRPITPTLRFKTTQVNDDLTLDMGDRGREAIALLLDLEPEFV